MAKKLKKNSLPTRKAKMLRGGLQAGELAQAMHIWKHNLELDQRKFREDPGMTEKRISTMTWEGCDNFAYELNPHIYKTWNTRVIEYWHALDNKCRIIRIRALMPVGTDAGSMVTRICKSDRTHAVARLKHKANIDAGVMVSAVQDNERYKLKENVGKLVAERAYEKFKELPGISEKRKLELAAETAFSSAVATGEAVGRTNLANEVLGILDNKPALIEADRKNNDGYSNSAKERRKTVEAKENENK